MYKPIDYLVLPILLLYQRLSGKERCNLDRAAATVCPWLLLYPENDEFGMISHRFKQVKEPALLAVSIIGSFAVDVIGNDVDIFEVAGFVVVELLDVAVMGILGGAVMGILGGAVVNGVVVWK